MSHTSPHTLSWTGDYTSYAVPKTQETPPTRTKRIYHLYAQHTGTASVRPPQSHNYLISLLPLYSRMVIVLHSNLAVLKNHCDRCRIRNRDRCLSNLSINPFLFVFSYRLFVFIFPSSFLLTTSSPLPLPLPSPLPPTPLGSQELTQ